jgi:hypothetical protein
MMKNKISLLVALFLFVGLITPKVAQAFDIREVFTSGDSIVVKIRERVEYFFANNLDKKVEVLEKQADRRLETAQNNIKNGDDSKVSNLLQNYLQIKNKQNDLLENTDEGVLGKVGERTLGQQVVMEEIKNNVDEGVKQEVIQVQETVVNQVAQRIVVANGTEGQTEFFQKVEHVWAPGTGAGGESGVVYEGGARLIFAPGASTGGNSGADIKTVEIKGN